MMPYNIEELKNLTKAEKLEIIQELLTSINNEIADEEFITDEDVALNERLAAYDSNNMKFYSWEEVKQKLKDRLKRT